MSNNPRFALVLCLAGALIYSNVKAAPRISGVAVDPFTSILLYMPEIEDTGKLLTIEMQAPDGKFIKATEVNGIITGLWVDGQKIDPEGYAAYLLLITRWKEAIRERRDQLLLEFDTLQTTDIQEQSKKKRQERDLVRLEEQAKLDSAISQSYDSTREARLAARKRYEQNP
jgi:hypothetical protein